MPVRSRSILIPACAMLLAAIGARPLAAQGDAKRTAVPASTADAPVLKEVSSFATPDETTELKAVLARLRARLTKDAALARRIEAAVAQGKNAEAERLLADAGGVAGAKATILSVAKKPARTSSAAPRDADLFRFASHRFNPWWIRITYESKTSTFTYCYDSKGGGCAS